MMIQSFYNTGYLSKEANNDNVPYAFGFNGISLNRMQSKSAENIHLMGKKE